MSLNSWLLFGPASISFLFIINCEAAHHYCIQDSTKSFSMNADSDQSEILLTNHRNLDGLTSSQRCSWEVRLGRMTEPLQLVLQLRLGDGRRHGGAASGPGCPSELTADLQGSEFHKIWQNGENLQKAPLIVAVMNSSQLLTVRFSTGASEPSASCGRIELRILIARKGFCGRNMLLHRGRCLLISDEKLRVSDLSGTGAELAAISGTEQLNELLRDNEHRAEQYPFIKPLSLSGPLRVGVFRCSDSERAVFSDSSSGSCAAMPFNSTVAEVNPTSSNHCTYLPGGVQLKGCNCSTRMRSLLSFSEVPDSSEKGRLRRSCTVEELCKKPEKNITQIRTTAVILCTQLFHRFCPKVYRKLASYFAHRANASAADRSHELHIFLEQLFTPYSPLSEV